MTPAKLLRMLLAVCLLCAAAPADELQFGDFKIALGGLAGPTDAAYDPDGALWIVERDTARLRVWPPDMGASRIAYHAGLDRPIALAFGNDDTLYVLDEALGAIHVLDRRQLMNGLADQYTPPATRMIGRRGFAPGEMFQPAALAFAHDRLYVADGGNHRIQVFTLDGELHLAFGSFGRGEGEFRRPLGVAVSEDGSIYVADGDNCRIQRFDAEGKFVSAWGEWGYFPGMFTEPAGVLWHSGRLYVTDHRNHRVAVYDAQGQLLYDWGLHAIRPREGEGKLHYPKATAISHDGTRAAVVEHFEDRVQVFGLETPAQAAARFNPLPPGSGPPSAHFGRHMHIGGELMALTEPDGHVVNVFDVEQVSPVAIHRFGMFGGGPGQFTRPTDLVIDRDGARLLVIDAGNRRIQDFAFERPEGEIRYLPNMTRLVRSISLPHLGERVPDYPDGAVLTPVSIDRDAAGNIYLLDAASARVIVMDRDWAFVRAWGGYGTGAGKMQDPTDLTVYYPKPDESDQPEAPAPGSEGANGEADDASPGRVLVVDAGNRRGLVFTLEGELLRTLTLDPQGGRSAPFRPFGGCALPDGGWLLSDEVGQRLVRFDSQGRTNARIGRPGLAGLEFRRPATMALDRRGKLIVIDYGNHRGQILDAAGLTFEQAFGSRLFVLPTRSLGVD